MADDFTAGDWVVKGGRHGVVYWVINGQLWILWEERWPPEPEPIQLDLFGGAA